MFPTITNCFSSLFCCCNKRKTNNNTNNINENTNNHLLQQTNETKIMPLLVYNSLIPFISLLYFHLIETQLTFTHCDILVTGLTICSVGCFMCYNINSLWRKFDIFFAYITGSNYFILSILQNHMNAIYDAPKMLSILYLYNFSTSFNMYVKNHYQYLVIEENDDENTQKIKQKLLTQYTNNYNGDKYSYYLLQVVHIPFRICAYTYCTIVHFNYYDNFLNETTRLQNTTNIILANIYISLLGSCYYYRNYIAN